MTTFTASGASFQGFMDGWSIIVNLEQPVILTVHEATGATTLTVKGDCTALAPSGDYWLLNPPPGVNPQTGTLASIDGDGNTTWHAAEPRDTSTAAARPNAPGRFLWAHYRYLPPMVGFSDDEGATVGEMGTNKLGNYHCRNRVYDILQGRWTSPDPAARHRTLFIDYAARTPIASNDPSGLDPRDESKERWLHERLPWSRAQDVRSDVYWATQKFTRAFFASRENRQRNVRRLIASDCFDKTAENGDRRKDDAFRIPDKKTFDLWAQTDRKHGCIEELEIEGHGTPYDMALAPNYICCQSHESDAGHITATQLGQQLRPYMCKDKCVIKLSSCNVALGTIPQEIANATGCEVRAHTGYCNVGQDFEKGCYRMHPNGEHTVWKGSNALIEQFFPGNTPVQYPRAHAKPSAFDRYEDRKKTP